MADFRQLALDFVLCEDEDEAKLTSIAQQTAKEIETSHSTTNPVARWVEAVQPWMPSRGGDDEEAQDLPDWPARAKALEFLARTLDFMSSEVLKPSQVKLLVVFFGAMFDVDHKAGVMASASALFKITQMKAFQASSALDILQKLCTLKDDFTRQIAKTRLAVYQLIQALLRSSEVAKDLKTRQGPSAPFMVELLQLCRNERDPDCLMVWFDVLRLFMTEYEPSPQILEEVYNTFKAYFPITLPRTAQSKVTPDELKTQLRACFSCNSDLAQHVFPFLVGKLDQGEGVTVNVKLDVLRTIKACIEQYQEPEQSVVPYSNRTWSSLKYEVRNGEVEDTIWATLEVLKALTTCLQGDNLRDYTLNVTRDCVNDLSSSLYCAAAGRLLLSVLSAGSTSFVMMTAPIITHVKENLRHPKSVTHSQDLLRLIRAILETRILLLESESAPSNVEDFVAIDGVFASLYPDIFKNLIEMPRSHLASSDDAKLATEGVQGAGALVCQKVSKLTEGQEGSERLLPESTCADISENLFMILLQYCENNIAHQEGSDELINETTIALQRVVASYPPSFRPIVKEGLTVMRSNWTTDASSAVSTIQALGPILAFVGCSDVSPLNGFGQFLELSCSLTEELLASTDAKADSRIWCALLASLQTVFRHFNDAALKLNPTRNSQFSRDTWCKHIVGKYPLLERLGSTREGGSIVANHHVSPTDLYDDFLLSSLWIIRLLYRRATAGSRTLDLSHDFTDTDKSFGSQYLRLLSKLASFIVHELSEAQQLALRSDSWVINLFQDDFRTHDIPSWQWLICGRVNVLAIGILEALRPAAVAALYESGIAQQLITEGVTYVPHDDPSASAVTRSILSILANKYKLETLEPLLQTLESQLSHIVSEKDMANKAAYMDQATSILAIAAGLLRRHSGNQTQGLLRVIREIPHNNIVGFALSRRLEIVVSPHQFLTKENYAVVKLLWTQRLYVQLVKPMLDAAVGSDQTGKTPLTKANFSIAVLGLVKYMTVSVYEDDLDKILRVAIFVGQNLGPGQETLAAINVLRTILAEASEKAQSHIRSIIYICTDCFSKRHSSYQLPAWLPDEARKTAPDPHTMAQCSKVSLEVLGSLPRLFESRHLLSYVAQVDRELATACGHRVRDVRSTARKARIAWAEVQ